MKIIKGYLDFIKENMNSLTEIGNDIFMSENINELPEGILLKHCYFKDESIKNGELGIFAVKIENECGDYGDNTIFISIGKGAKIITIRSTIDYLDSKGILFNNSKYIEDKYLNHPITDPDTKSISTLDDLWNNCDPNIAYYETQKEALKTLKIEFGDFDVLEMMYEDELAPHQYLILNKKLF